MFLSALTKRCSKCRTHVSESLFTKRKTVCDDCAWVPRPKQCRRCETTDPSKFTKTRVRICKDCYTPSNGIGIKRSKTEQKLLKQYPLLWERFNQAKSRASNKNRIFDITPDDILSRVVLQNSKCYYSGADMDFHNIGSHSVSLDRVDADLGYTVDNTVLCCAIINRMKFKLTIEELREWANRVVEYNA